MTSSENVAPGKTGQVPARTDDRAADVRVRRERLRAALVDLDRALSATGDDRDAHQAQFLTAAEVLREVLEQHVEDTQAPGGMIEQLHEDAPWLAGRIDHLEAEHEPLLATAAAVVADARQGADHETVRRQALDLLHRVEQHRQRGTDLLFEAYMIDLSAGD